MLLCTFYVFESAMFNLSEFSSNKFCSRLFLYYLHEMHFSLPTFCQSSWSVLWFLIQLVSVWSSGVLLETFRSKRQRITWPEPDMTFVFWKFTQVIYLKFYCMEFYFMPRTNAEIDYSFCRLVIIIWYKQLPGLCCLLKNTDPFIIFLFKHIHHCLPQKHLGLPRGLTILH